VVEVVEMEADGELVDGLERSEREGKTYRQAMHCLVHQRRGWNITLTWFPKIHV
jgi:hypothetical protein